MSLGRSLRQIFPVACTLAALLLAIPVLVGADANAMCVKSKKVKGGHTVPVDYKMACGKTEITESGEILKIGGKGCDCEDDKAKGKCADANSCTGKCYKEGDKCKDVKEPDTSGKKDKDENDPLKVDKDKEKIPLPKKDPRKKEASDIPLPKKDPRKDLDPFGGPGKSREQIEAENKATERAKEGAIQKLWNKTSKKVDEYLRNAAREAAWWKIDNTGKVDKVDDWTGSSVLNKAFSPQTGYGYLDKTPTPPAGSGSQGSVPRYGIDSFSYPYVTPSNPSASAGIGGSTFSNSPQPSVWDTGASPASYVSAGSLPSGVSPSGVPATAPGQPSFFSQGGGSSAPSPPFSQGGGFVPNQGGGLPPPPPYTGSGDLPAYISPSGLPEPPPPPPPQYAGDPLAVNQTPGAPSWGSYRDIGGGIPTPPSGNPLTTDGQFANLIGNPDLIPSPVPEGLAEQFTPAQVSGPADLTNFAGQPIEYLPSAPVGSPFNLSRGIDTANIGANVEPNFDDPGDLRQFGAFAAPPPVSSAAARVAAAVSAEAGLQSFASGNVSESPYSPLFQSPFDLNAAGSPDAPLRSNDSTEFGPFDGPSVGERLQADVFYESTSSYLRSVTEGAVNVLQDMWRAIQGGFF